MAYEHGLDFGGTEPLSGDLDRVVGAAENVPETILIHRSPIPVDPDVGESAPVGLKITIGIFPKTARHADPGLADDKLAHLSTNRRSFSSTTSAAMPGTAPEKEQALSGVRTFPVTRPPEVSVPPE